MVYKIQPGGCLTYPREMKPVSMLTSTSLRLLNRFPLKTRRRESSGVFNPVMEALIRRALDSGLRDQRKDKSH